MFSEVVSLLSNNLKQIFLNTTLNKSKISEIKIRADKPLVVRYEDRLILLGKNGEQLLDSKNDGEAYIVDIRDIKETLNYMSKYSLYAYEDELKQGYLTIKGGHRVGICGRVSMSDSKVLNYQYITALNIRIAKDMRGICDRILPCLMREGNVYHTLIISPPGCGKTTLLRDIVRNLSNRGDLSVAVADERSEIAACYHGVSQMDLGINIDILDGCSKAFGVEVLIRTMTPDVVFFDEIGGLEDVKAVLRAASSGVSVVATMHGRDYMDIKRNGLLSNLMEDKIIERYIVLSKRNGVGTIEHILDENGENVCGFD